MLEYVALLLLLIVIVLLFYTFIYLHEIPYEIAKHRNHPQQEAIYVACWLSLFTLHAIWPIVFIWAISKPNPLRVVFAEGAPTGDSELARRLGDLEQRFRRIEERTATTGDRPATADDGKRTPSATVKA